jgi:DNA-binding winged helix-turn-helix (wHTH) protein
MNHDAGPETPAVADFRLAGWLVEPSLNRVSSEERVVQLEPKLMDVLVFLASQAGRVVSKHEITDAVWPETFITESVITRSIAGIRRAFGDDVRNPAFIETISKRGYRLIAPVAAAAAAADRTMGHSGQRPPEAAAPQVERVPFVVGQWVRSEYFYGRITVLDEVLQGNRNWLWLLGTRRVGKTSTLKQLEHLALSRPELGFVPVFWDLQGAEHPDDLHLDFADALLDAEPRLHEAGVHLADVRSDDLFDSLGRLRRELHRNHLKLLLLCDEVEELIHIAETEPALLRKLRRAMQSREGIRSVLASSNRLWLLAGTDADTSPFLDGFTPPLYLGALNDEDARALARQDKLAPGSRPGFDADTVERICRECGNHPYLIQLLCRRTLDRGDLDVAIQEVARDRAVGFFFAVDLELLDDSERAILRTLAEQPGITEREIQEVLTDCAADVPSRLSTLQNLGLVARDAADHLRVRNGFLRGWLAENAGRP